MATTDDPINPDPIHANTGQAFPVDNPVQALLRDHDMVRRLSDYYLNSDSMEVKKQAATQLLQAIHMHSRLEESAFYPNVREVAPDIIGRFEHDHLKVDDLLATLQGMSPEEPRFEALMRDMLSSLMTHIQQEESEFFPQLQQANIDMMPIGLEMQAFEATMVHTQAQLSDQVRPR